MARLKILMVTIFVLSLMVTCGCESKCGTAGIGAAGGAVAAGGGYEYFAN